MCDAASIWDAKKVSLIAPEFEFGARAFIRFDIRIFHFQALFRTLRYADYTIFSLSMSRTISTLGIGVVERKVRWPSRTCRSCRGDELEFRVGVGEWWVRDQESGVRGQ